MKKSICTLLVALFSVILFFSGFRLYEIYRERQESKIIFDDLANQIIEPTGRPEGEEKQAQGQVPKTKETREKYKEILKQNQDFVGWIKIDGTPINYPVMQTVDRPSYYLERDFNREYNKHGVPFVDEQCSVTKPSDNITIYAHHMKDGTMFSSIDKYKEESFYKEHPTIQFDTLDSSNEYQIIAAFKTVVDSEEGFKYYEFRDAHTEDEFENYISNIKERSFYNTGVSAQYGDKLITLSTCEYSQKNGRVVVVAKLIKV